LVTRNTPAVFVKYIVYIITLISVDTSCVVML